MPCIYLLSPAYCFYMDRILKSPAFSILMSNSGRFFGQAPKFPFVGDITRQEGTDTRVPLLNLATVQIRVDSLERFLSDSISRSVVIGPDQMEMVSTEIVSAIHQIIVNGAALLSCSQPEYSSFPAAGAAVLPEGYAVMGNEEIDGGNDDGDCEVIELDAVELLAEHIHFCDICGKGFKRDANLRMHMRAHGNQFKTPEALAKPDKCMETQRRVRFSCPYQGCNRNKGHKKFRALKSVICVKNHFKRSHCPKMYSCNRCNKKSFSVLADLRSHLKHCGESKWRCSCGTSFSRKDKLFGHMALFEGHMPAVENGDEKSVLSAAAVAAATMEEDEHEDEDGIGKEEENGMFEGLFQGFGSIGEYCLQDVLSCSFICNKVFGLNIHC
ncbi:unnamed protein product, partial [Vitis vinifera]